MTRRRGRHRSLIVLVENSKTHTQHFDARGRADLDFTGQDADVVVGFFVAFRTTAEGQQCFFGGGGEGAPAA